MVEEVNRIIATHGPMGYPVAVGVVAGLARRQTQVNTKATQFGQYSERFDEHAATYLKQDRAGAEWLNAIGFPDVPDAIVAPTPPTDPIELPPDVVCWIGDPNADAAAYCPARTTQHMYVDDKGQWFLREAETGVAHELPRWNRGGDYYLPAPPAPARTPLKASYPGRRRPTGVTRTEI